MNVSELLMRSAARFPGRLAVAKGNKELDYRTTERRVRGLTNSLADLGVRKGDRVGLIQGNGTEYVESLFACFHGGLCAVPVNSRLHREEWSYIFDNAEAKAVIFTEEFLEDVRKAKERLSQIAHWVCIGKGTHEGVLTYEDLVGAGSINHAGARVEPEDLAWLFYTSGTTGRPKGVMWSHRTVLRMTMNLLADVCPGLGPEDAALHAAPLSHASGTCALPNVARGAANVILDAPTFDPAHVLRTIQERKITNGFMAPTMIRVLLDYPLLDAHDLSSLRYVVYGGAPMYVEDLKEALQKIGPVFVQIFGQGEAPMTITYLPREEHVLDGDPEQLKRLGSAGVARTDVEVRVVGEDGVSLPAGAVGEIVTRSDLVMAGYWKDPKATSEALRDGWLHTGDVGMLDDRGYLYILDRTKDMVISGGSNIYPREVEEVLLTHPAIGEVCVFGVPDPKWGEAVKAVVVLKSGKQANEKDVIDYCRERMASYKKPKTVDFVPTLPKSPYGKILKRELREPYWAGRDRRV